MDAARMLAGKRALITGGSSGIGRATALRLASLGAQIVVASRNQTALDEVVTEVEKNGGQALAVATDVTQPEDCRRAVAATVTHFGRLDIERHAANCLDSPAAALKGDGEVSRTKERWYRNIRHAEISRPSPVWYVAAWHQTSPSPSTSRAGAILRHAGSTMLQRSAKLQPLPI